MDYLSSPITTNTVVQLLPFNSLIKINRNSSTAVYQQIANAVINLIHEAVIKPGSPIPSSRIMASTLGVHRKTVVAAYEELLSQDWIVSVARKGMMVASNLPELKPRSFHAAKKNTPYENNIHASPRKANTSNATAHTKNIYRFVINDGFPDPRLAPLDALLRQYRYFLKRPALDSMTMYSSDAGSINLRNALAAFLSNTRGLNIEAGNVLVTRGAQMAIYIAGKLLIKPGSRVIVGEPNYAMANSIFEQFGAKLIKVPVDENGINVDEIERIIKKNKPDMLYIIPHHHHPTTVTLSAARRMKLLSIIREYKLPVIEDDYDYDFHYTRSPILPLASADHKGYVIYIGSITKTIASSIRLGYLISSANFITQAAHTRQMIDIRGDILMEESLAILFNNGEMQKHLKKSIKTYQQRRDLFCSLLESQLGDKVIFTKPAGGMSVWVRFAKKYNLKEIAAKAAATGLFMADGSTYNTGSIDYNGIRIGFASLNEKEIRGVIGILEKLVGN